MTHDSQTRESGKQTRSRRAAHQVEARAHVRPAAATSLRPTLLAVLIAAAVGTLAAAPTAWAQAVAAENARQSFQYPAQPLLDALRAFGRQTQYQVLFDDALVAQRQAPALSGNYTPREALERLLAGSGLTAISAQPGTFTLRKVPPQASESTLAPVVVTAQAERSGRTEGSGSYAATGPSSTATRLGLSLRETPQSISVVTREQIDDRGFQSLDEVALDATGLTTRQIGGGERTQFFARGFEITSFLADGVPLAFDYDTQGTATMAMYDRVEVLRGAAGLMVGTGNPSGTINLVRKKPTATPQVSITASAGSWANYRGEVDAAGPLNAAGTLRGRAVLALQDSDTFKRAYRHERQLVYGTLEADIAPGTLLSLGGYYSREDNPGADWNGLPTQRDGSFYQFDRSRRLTPDWAYWNKENTSAFAELEHRLANGWTAQATARVLRSRMDMLGTYLSPRADSDTLFNQRVGAYTYEKTQYSLDAQAKGPWRLFGRTHDVVVGASLRRNGDDDGPGGWPSEYTQIVDPLTWDSGGVAVPAIDNLWSRSGHQRQHGIYGTVRFSLSDPLALLVGARLDSYRYQMNIASGPTWRSNVAYRVSDEFTPYAGLVYTLDDRHSVYASWASVFQPQSNQSASGTLLNPVTGTNVEAGVKGEYFGGRLTASAAVFQINQENLPLALPLANCLPGLTSCYAPAGEVRARGAEFELAGEVAPGWQVATGYTYYTARHVKDSTSAKAGTPYDTQTPRHLFKFSTNWRLPGAWQNWSVGGAVRTRSETSRAPIRNGGYTIVDLMAAWQVNRHLDIRLNLNNVFDKYYYQTIGSTQDNNHFGAPRNAMLTARYRF